VNWQSDMENTLQANNPADPFDIKDQKVNYIHKGEGTPVILVHGIAASLHDWDELVPELAANGFAAYALDLLGHGKSGKPSTRTYHVEWLFDHFAGWVDSLHLTQPFVLCGHSLGSYLTLEYARRFPARTRGLILSNPYYRTGQLSSLLRLSYHRPHLNGLIIERTPHWMFRMIIDATSLAMGRTRGAVHHLSEKVRHQTTIDYKRTSPGVYNLPNTVTDLLPHLPEVHHPTLVIWGDHDLTLSPDSFPQLANTMPNAKGKVIHGAGHVPHQSDPKEFNQAVMEFMRSI
jgi:pimeloyl-ACP methyl ester carboxylesterase